VALARIRHQDVLLDPGFPLPGVVPLEPDGEEYATGYGRLSVATGPGVRRLLLDARGETRELYRINWPPARFAPDGRPGRGLPEPGERFRLEGDRFLRWRDGEMEVADVWSRLLWPLPGSEAGLLEAFFRVPASGLAAIPAKPAPARLSVYDASSLEPPELEARLAARCSDPASLPEGWADSPVVQKSWSFSSRPSGTRVKLTASLAVVPSCGLAEAVRKTLVFHLVTELFEFSRDRTAEGQ
jgi:hypothetical protein